MNILIVRNYPSYMDVRHRTYNIQELGLAKALTRMGNTCGIIFWTDKQEEDMDYIFGQDRSIKIYYRRGKSLFHNMVFHDIKDIVAQYDMIQTNEYNQFQAWLLAKNYPQKTIIYHGPYYSAYNKKYNAMCWVFDLFFLNRYIKNQTHFIVKSHLAERFLLKKGIKGENIRTLGVGIDLGALSSEGADVPEFIRQAKASNEVFKMLYIGHLDEGRNILFMLEVVAAIKRQGYPVKLIMVGTGEKEYTEKCWKLADKLAITEDIHYTGRVEQKYLSNLYTKADFFLLPTRFDIFGMVLLEAMYYGLAGMTTENGGSTMMIQNGVNGYRMELDVQTWANQIISLKKDTALLLSIKEAAHKTVAEHYTWDVLAPKFIKEYEDVKS